jgi:uncharacterized integral membrane protein
VRSASNTIAGKHDLSIRQIIVVALLVIFAIANYAVQTHVHGNYLTGPLATSAKVLSDPGPAEPADNDLQHCPLCQEFLSGGSFLVPIGVIIVTPVLTGDAVFAMVARVYGHLRSHSWRGRGPPAV